MSAAAIRALQHALNTFTSKYLKGLPKLDVDGEKGKLTNRRIMTAKWYLGYGNNRDGTVKPAFLRRLKSPHNPLLFTPAMYATGFSRRRKYRGVGEGPSASIAWAAHQYALRIKENPPGTNKGPGITVWQRALGSYLVGLAWCGVFVGTALEHAGVKGINARVAGVANIEDDAKAGRNGFKSWHGPRAAKPGWAAVMFGRGIHVELVAEVHSWGYTTYGGNTSYQGSTGSQSNGGCVAKRSRPWGDVYGVAEPNY